MASRDKTIVDMDSSLDSDPVRRALEDEQVFLRTLYEWQFVGRRYRHDKTADAFVMTLSAVPSDFVCAELIGRISETQSTLRRSVTKQFIEYTNPLQYDDEWLGRTDEYFLSDGRILTLSYSTGLTKDVKGESITVFQLDIRVNGDLTCGSCWSRSHVQLDRIRLTKDGIRCVEQTLIAQVNHDSTEGQSEVKPKKKTRGRPKGTGDTDKNRDKRLASYWKTERFNSYAEAAATYSRECNDVITTQEFRKAVDRHRQRATRAGQN